MTSKINNRISITRFKMKHNSRSTQLSKFSVHQHSALLDFTNCLFSMSTTMEPKLSDIMLSLSDIKNQVTNLRNCLDLLTPTPTKSIFEQSLIGTKAFERAMENLDIDLDDIQNLPMRYPRRSTIYENSMKFKEPLVNESNIQMLYIVLFNLIYSLPILLCLLSFSL